MITTFRTIAGGFFMGMADLVPGVSGGTIALVLGIYERLVASIREGSSALGWLVRLRTRDAMSHLRRVEWAFLVPLLAGIGLAVVLLANFLERQLEERPTILAGLFLGLVVASVLVAWRKLRGSQPSHVIIAVTVGTALFALLGVGEGTTGSSPHAAAYLGAGALAICAMILPGISGSLILLMLGMYAPVLGAVTQREIGTIAVFALGAVVGLALFSQILHWALERHHDRVLAGLVGLMAGSTRVLWPWPDGVSAPTLGAPSGDVGLVVVAFALGAVAVLGISRLAPDEGLPES